MACRARRTKLRRSCCSISGWVGQPGVGFGSDEEALFDMGTRRARLEAESVETSPFSLKVTEKGTNPYCTRSWPKRNRAPVFGLRSAAFN